MILGEKLKSELGAKKLTGTFRYVIDNTLNFIPTPYYDIIMYLKIGPGQSGHAETSSQEHLLAEKYALATVNAALASLNAFFIFTGWEECRVKALRIQRRAFRDPNQELTQDEYDLLVSAAYENGKKRLGLLMDAICATGIRVSKVKYITVEAARCGKAEIFLKGNIRTIMLPGKLCRKLLKYAKKQKIASFKVFLIRNRKGLFRRQIWAEMKAVCKAAGSVPPRYSLTTCGTCLPPCFTEPARTS